jgi:hypothetical protein
VRRHLTVEHRRADVGVVRRDLAPAFAAVVGPHPDHADELVAEGLNRLDPHAGQAAGQVTCIS